MKSHRFRAGLAAAPAAPALTAIAPAKAAWDDAGVSAEAMVGLGLGANVLVAGAKRSIAPQPPGIQARSGFNLAAGVTAIRLDPR